MLMSSLNISKLVAFDMSVNNKWLIFTEFLVGSFGSFALSYFLLGNSHLLTTAMGFWLIGIGINYLPLSIYSGYFIIKNNYLEHAQVILDSPVLQRQYNAQQFLVTVPFFFAVLLILQFFTKKI